MPQPARLIDLLIRTPHAHVLVLLGSSPAVSRSGLKLWSRCLPVALLWVIGTSLSAHADGCHAPDRPVLGLSFSLEEANHAPPILDRAEQSAPRVVPVPCSGEVPGSTGRAAPPQPGAVTSPSAFAFAAARIASHFAREPVALDGRILLDRLDRPPRSAAFAV
jgi:hypothetical protein